MNNNEVIRSIKELKKNTKNHSIFEVEDLATLDFAMKDHLKALLFVYCEELCYSDLAKRVINYFKSNSKEVYEVSEKLYERVVDKDNAQGLIATFKAPTYNLNDYKDARNIVILDGIETPGNVGTMIRTCDACRTDLIIITNEKARLFSPKTMLASRGMQLFVPIIESDYETTQKFLDENHFDVYLAEPIEGKDYQKYTYQGKNAIVVGSERYGIDKRYFDHPHLKVFIPMKGRMTSLNVGVAASIIIYEAFMQQNR